jgi:hypothetical protein
MSPSPQNTHVRFVRFFIFAPIARPTAGTGTFWPG